MANRVISQTLIDNNKRTLIKYIVISDGSATANSSLIKFNELRFAMNANNYIANTDPKTNYGVSIKRIFGNSKIQNAAGYISLKWESGSNTEIVAITSGQFDIDFGSMTGDNAVIPSPDANNKGLIYSATSPTSGDIVNLFVDLRKDSKDFDAGQTADPVAFNRNWQL